MKESLKIIRDYYKLSKVKWQLVLLEFIVLIIPSMLSILSPVLTASVISSITVFDFKNAKIMLALDFGIILLTAGLYFVYHIFSSKLQREILISASSEVYNKVRANKKIDHVTSATTEDIWTFSTFNSNLLYKLCFLIKSLIILGIIFAYNFFLALILFLVSIISALLLSITNKQIQKHTLTLSKAKGESLELFNNIQRGTDLEGNNYMEGTMRYKYMDSVINCSKTNSKITLFYNLNNNFISLILKTAVFLSTFYLISQIQSTFLTLPVFLVLTPYLTSSAQNLIAFFEIFPEIGIVQNILREFDKLSPEEIEPENTSKPNSFKIEFIHASFSDDYNSISNLNLNIEEKEIIQIIGKGKSGKRAVAQILTKKSLPTSGTVLLGGKNIVEITSEEFSKLVYITYKEPYFYSLSILENLKAASKKTKINKCIETLNLSNLIKSLPNGLDTIISSKVPPKTLFFLGLVRAYLSDAKIILIYEIPSNLDDSERETLKHIISVLSQNSTVILFLHEEFEIACKKILIENGKIG